MSRNGTDLEFGKYPRHKNRNPDDGYLGTISDKIWLVTLAKQLPFASKGPAEMPSNAVMRMFVFACLILATMGSCFGQSKSEEQTQKQPSIKVQTTLVMMPAIVTGRHGEYVKDLGEKDFDVLRDGKIQRIGFFRHVVTNAERDGTARRSHEHFGERQPAIDYLRGRSAQFVVRGAAHNSAATAEIPVEIAGREGTPQLTGSGSDRSAGNS
jgi:hypothetical protein